jgi:hypothetical protein
MGSKRLPPHINEELEAAGAVLIETGWGGKHPFIRFQLHGEVRKFGFPGTASDHRSMLNNRCEFRRLLRRVAEEARNKKQVA